MGVENNRYSNFKDFPQANLTIYDVNPNKYVDLSPIPINLNPQSNGEWLQSVNRHIYVIPQCRILNSSQKADLMEAINESFGYYVAPKMRTLKIAEADEESLKKAFSNSEVRERAKKSLDKIRKFIDADAINDKFEDLHKDRVLLRQAIGKALSARLVYFGYLEDWSEIMRCVLGPEEFNKISYRSLYRGNTLAVLNENIAVMSMLFNDEGNLHHEEKLIRINNQLAKISKKSEDPLESGVDKIDVARKYVDAAATVWNLVYGGRGSKKLPVQVT